jgi:dTDP-4-dehydrorhamnose 3,5-epimerase
MDEPTIIPGGLHVDDRGAVSFVNDFHFDDVRRLYLIENHAPGTVRAWHGHRRQDKWAICVRGAVVVCAVPLEWFDELGRDPARVPLYRFTLSEWQPAVLHIPPGYANGAMSLTPGGKTMWFSSLLHGEDPEEEINYPANVLPDVWQVNYR